MSIVTYKRSILSSLFAVLLCCISSVCCAQAEKGFSKEDYTVSSLLLDYVLPPEHIWRDRYEEVMEQVRTGDPVDTARLKTLDSLNVISRKIGLRVALTGISTLTTVVMYDPDTLSTSTIMEYYAPPDTMFAESIRNSIRLRSLYRYDIKKLYAQKDYALIQSNTPGNGFDPIVDIALAKPVFNDAHNRCCVYYELGTGKNGCAGFVYLTKENEQWQAVKYVNIFCL